MTWNILESRRRRLSRRLAVVVSQDAAQPLAAFDLAAGSANFLARLDQLVVEPLVIALQVVVLQVLIDRLAQRRLAEKNYSRQTFVLDRPHKALEVRVQVRASRRQQDAFRPLVLDGAPKRLAELRVAVHQQILLAVQRAVVKRRQVARDLLHPRAVGIHRDARQVNPPRLQFHHEQQVEGGQAPLGPDLDRGKVDRRQHVPVRLDKSRPRRLALSLGRWLDAVGLENVADRRVGNLMAQVSQGALNAIVTPTRVFLRHPQHELVNLFIDLRPSWRFAFVGVIPFLGDQLACQRRMVSGVTIVATCSRALRPSALPFTASIRRSSSVKGIRFFPTLFFKMRFSATR